jgi:lipopolysaccharide export LptBFGC system permease protein LptF
MILAERYLFWRAMKAIAVATPGFVAVMTLSHAHPVYDLYSRNMIGLGELFYLLALWVPMMVYLSMPMILALAIGCAYAVSMQDHEITVLHAAGVGTGRIVLPGMLAALAGAVFCGANSLYLLPVSFQEFRDRSFLAEKNIGPGALRENQFNEVRPWLDVFFERRLAGNQVRNVVVFLRDAEGLTAVAGKLAGFERVDRRLTIVFHDGYVTKTPAATVPGAEPTVVRFATYVQEIARTYTAEDLAERGLGFYERHLPALLDPPASEKLGTADRTGWIVEGYKRLLHPLLCIAYALAAIALALGAGRGRRANTTDVLFRIMGFLVALHPAYLVAIGVLSREPGIDGRIVFLYPFLIAFTALAFIARIDHGQPAAGRAGAIEQLLAWGRRRTASG